VSNVATVMGHFLFFFPVGLFGRAWAGNCSIVP
jgi:hypothetical protein